MILLGGSQVVRLGSVCVAPLGTSPLRARAIRGSLRGSSQGDLGSSGLAVEAERSAETQGDARGQWQRGEKLFICRQRDASLRVGVTGMCGQVIWICFGSWSLPGAPLIAVRQWLPL